MIHSLIDETNLRGYAFEFVAKALLRRQQKNNFIFELSQFDPIDEILLKYRLNTTSKITPTIELLRKEWNKCDLLEFILNNKKTEISKTLNFMK